MTSLSNGLIDSQEVKTILGITDTNLRQLVFRKQLVVHGREKKRSLFSNEEVLALQARRLGRKKSN